MDHGTMPGKGSRMAIILADATIAMVLLGIITVAMLIALGIITPIQIMR